MISDGPHISNGYKHYVEEGRNATVECRVESNPPATVWWEKEGDNSTRYNGNMLDLTLANRNQGGTYICFAASDRKYESGMIEVLSNETFVVDVQCKLFKGQDSIDYIEWGAHFRHNFPCFLQFMCRSFCF